MWRALVFVGLVVVAGCASNPSAPAPASTTAEGTTVATSTTDTATASTTAPTRTTTADSTTTSTRSPTTTGRTTATPGTSTTPPPTSEATTPEITATPTPVPDRENPWGERVLTVAVENAANESRNFVPLVRDALEYWEGRSERYAGYAVEYDLDPDAEDPDLVARFVERIDSCAEATEPAGCAPFVTGSGPVPRPIAVEVATGYTNESTVRVLKHEFGHTLGLDHDDEPRSIMTHTSTLTTLSRPDATERALPWADANFTVYLDTSAVDDPAAVREQVRHALEYYEGGAAGTVPANATFTMTDDREAADVVITFPSESPCGGDGSCGRVGGVDTDDDGALEEYERLEIAIVGIDAPAVGWHVGYWLGYGFGFREGADWPAPFRDASYAERRSEWWE